MARKKAQNPDDELLQRIKERYRTGIEAWRDQYERGKAEVAFCDGRNQWDDKDRMAREGQGRPCLTVDRMTPFIDQLANDQRQNRQSITVHPVDDNADVDTAEIISGLIRHIEYDSNADTAYDTGFLGQLRGGIGFLRLYLDYCDYSGFDQDIKIARVEDPFRVFIDPSSTAPDGADAMWACVETPMAMDEFKRRFPAADSASAQSQEWESLSGDDRVFLTGDKDRPVRVLEYFEKVGSDSVICLLRDGTVCKESEVPEGQVPMRKRTVTNYTIKQVFANALEILDQTTFPGEMIPIVPIYGQELITEGKRHYFGLVTRLMGIQQIVNYQKSSLVETIALAPKAPWLIAKESVEGYEREWEQANNSLYAYLPFNATDTRGNSLPMPQRVMGEPAIGAIAQTLAGTEEDLKAVTGMYDPTLGNRSDSGQSGVAIRSLQHQGQMGNFHFQDNLSRSLRQLGRIIIGIIPLVYDAPRTIRIVKEDDTQDTIRINEAHTDSKTGKPMIYDLTTGEYDVVVSSGPSYATRRQENLAVMMDMMRSLPPQVAMVLSDLVVSQMDTPIAKQIQERLKKMLPPQLQDDPQGHPPIPAPVQAQMQQMGQHMQQQDAAMHDLMNQLDAAKSALASKEADIEAKVRVAEIQAEASIQVAAINGASKADLATLQANVDKAQSLLDAFIAKDAQLGDQAHEFAMSQTPPPMAPTMNGQAPPAMPPTQPGPNGPPNAGPPAGGDDSNA